MSSSSSFKTWFWIGLVVFIIGFFIPVIGHLISAILWFIATGFAVKYLANYFFGWKWGYILSCIVGILTGGTGVIVALIVFFLFDQRNLAKALSDMG